MIKNYIKIALDQARHEYAEMENMALARAQAALLKVKSNAELARIARSTLSPTASVSISTS